MKLKYNNNIYALSVLSWIKANLLCIELLSRRLLRFLKRIVLYLRSYLLTMICIVAFVTVTIPIGLTLDKYTSWLDGFWDLRLFFLTSILISIVGSITTREIKRHQALLFQFDAYQKFQFESDTFIKRLCNIINFDTTYGIFHDEEAFENFYLELQNFKPSITKEIANELVIDENLLHSTKTIARSTFLSITIKQYYRSIDNLKSNLEAHVFIGNVSHCLNQLDYIYNEILAEQTLIEDSSCKYIDSQLHLFVDNISRCIYPSIADIRHPWRWDAKRHEIIKSIIVNILAQLHRVYGPKQPEILLTTSPPF